MLSLLKRFGRSSGTDECRWRQLSAAWDSWTQHLADLQAREDDPLPKIVREVRAWDFVATPDPSADATAGVRMALINPDSVIFTDAIVERFEPADIERLILETAEEDGKGVEKALTEEQEAATESARPLGLGQEPAGENAERIMRFANGGAERFLEGDRAPTRRFIVVVSGNRREHF